MRHQFEPHEDLKRNSYANKLELRHDFDLSLQASNEDANTLG